MPQPVRLPASFSARTADESIIACNRLIEGKGDALVDASDLRFADPFGLALLGATFHLVRTQGRSVAVRGLSHAMSGYLGRMDVFEGVGLVDCVPPQNDRRDRSDALVELTLLHLPRQVDEAAYRLAKTLVGGIPGVNPDEPPDEMSGYTAFDRLVEPVQYALSELLENALTHGRKQGFRDACVWVASQYYAKSGLIRLGVVDNGCGFLATLRSHPDLRRETHLEAILTALRPRISCNRDLRLGMESVNQGVGLTTVSRIAEHAGGRLTIVSGDAIHDTAGRSRSLADGVSWQGVAIGMVCRRDRLPAIRFGELLPPYEGHKPALRFE